MKYKLNELNIDAVSKEVNAYLIKRKTEDKDRVHTKLSVEDVLLDYMDAFGSDAEFTVDYGVGLSKRKIRLSVPGTPLDPFVSTGAASEDELLLANVLSRIGQRPKWQYARGINTITYTPAKKSIPEWEKLLISIAAAVLLGMVARAMPANISMVLQQDIVSPLLDTFLGFLNAVAGPMIFLSVVWGIYSIGDVSTFSEMGRSICVRFILFQCIMTILVALIFMPFFSLQYGIGQSGNQYSALYQMVLDIIPDNLFTPFTMGNTLQIMFVAIAVGIMMLRIGRDTQVVADLVEQLGAIVDGLMGVISSLVPVFVFGSLFMIIASSDLGSLVAGGKYFACTVAACILLILIHTAMACAKMHIGPLDLWKRTFSTFFIALTTASSTAALVDNKKTCIKKLGISERVANFGVPFGQLLYGPGTTVVFWFAAVCVAESSGTGVSMVWFVTAIFISNILSVASPPVPGGITASFTILFTQLALPTSNLAVILSLASILDFVSTAANVFTGQCMLAITSRSIEGTKAEVNA